MENDSDKKFFAQLSEAELDEAEQVERDVQAAFQQGWSEETASAFIHGVMLIRKRQPDMLIPNMVDLALRQGIASIVASVYVTEGAVPQKRKINGKSKLSGNGA